MAPVALRTIGPQGHDYLAREAHARQNIDSHLVAADGTIRRRLLEQCDVHTLLRLPTGISMSAA